VAAPRKFDKVDDDRRCAKLARTKTKESRQASLALLITRRSEVQILPAQQSVSTNLFEAPDSSAFRGFVDFGARVNGKITDSAR
jgi:hypothetical protein